MDPFNPYTSPAPDDEREPSGDFLTDAPLPPHWEELLLSAEREIDAEEGGLLAAIGAIVSEAERELDPVAVDVATAVATVVGTADGELRTAESDVYKITEKVWETIFRDLIYAEEDMRSVGIAIPRDVETQRVDMDDPTGERVLDRLMGVEAAPPAYYDVPPPVTYDPVSPPTSPSPPDTGEPAPEPTSPPPDPSAGEKPECGCSPPPINLTCPPPTVVVMPPVGGGIGSIGGAIPPPVVAPPVSPGTPEPTPGTAPDLSPPTSPPPPDVPVGGGGGGGAGGGAGDPADVVHPIRVPETWVGLQWNRETVCADADMSVADLRRKYAPRATGIASEEPGGLVSEWYRRARGAADGLIEYVTGGFDKERAKEAMRESYARTGDILNATTSARTFIDYMPAGSIADPALSYALAFQVGTGRKAEGETGIPLGQIGLPLEYLLNYIHPFALPSQTELDDWVVTGAISKERWRCLTRALGNDPVLRDIGLPLKLAAPTTPELVVAKNRGAFVGKEAEWDRLIKRQALDPDALRIYEALAVSYAGPADLTRFMLRDVADDDVVKRYNYDQDFEKKLYGPGGKAAPGPMGKWMAAQGVPEELMRYYWRAHWDIPSNTALYDMLHRLRPDRPEVDKWEVEHGILARAKGEAPAVPRPLVVTVDDVREAVKTNDMAPGWVEPIIAISYHPITRTDAIDAFHAGAFTETDLFHAMRDNGYSPENAQRLVDIQKAKKGARLANQSGVWSVRKIMRAYQDGTIDGVTADALLAPLIVSPENRSALIEGADREVRAGVKSAFLKRARNRYMIGEWDDDELAANLRANGIANNRVPEIVARYSEDRRGRYKEPAARQVAKWLQLAIIQPDDALDRLQKIGYSLIDSQRIVYEGIHAHSKVVRAEEEKIGRGIKALINDVRKAKRTETGDLEKRLKELQALEEKQRKERERIQKELEDRLP